MLGIMRKPFGKTQAGEEAGLYTITDGMLSVSVTDFGAAIQSLIVPDRNGNLIDIVLGYDALAGYETQKKYLGAVIGRCANRIAQGGFKLDGVWYPLERNSGQNHLHGGNGFDKRLWIATATQDGVRFSLHSAAGDNGYPGALDATVTYSVAAGALRLRYEAVCSAPTLCNLTNHVYFNLAGHASGEIGAQQISIEADAFTPVDENAVPTGEIRPVGGTPMDLRGLAPIGAHWDDADEQLLRGKGYDHNFIVRGETGLLRTAAKAYAGDTGIRMAVETTMPGVQFYSGNALADTPIGKGGAEYAKRGGFCLETQYYPDAVHHPAFPQPVLRPDEHYDHITIFRFTTG